jgi:Holliday junction DNA helicase RuvA
MFYLIKGKIILIKPGLVVVESAGIGYKISVSGETFKKLPKAGEEVRLFLHLYLREDAVELFGFSSEEELEFFEALNSVSGIGPKIALGILGLAPAPNLKAAIKQGQSEILTKTFGVGKKTAGRIIVELKDKIEGGDIKFGGYEADVLEALVGLGYSRKQAREALNQCGGECRSAEEKLKQVLKKIN